MLNRLMKFAPDDVGGGEPNTGDGTGSDTPTPGTGPAMFTPEQQAHIDKLMGQARKEARERTQAEQEAATKKAAAKAEAEKLAAQQEWQQLAQTRQDELAVALGRIEAMTVDNLRIRIATKMGLPAPLAERLRGTTEEEIMEDAKALQKLIPVSGGLPQTPKPQGDTKIPDEEKRQRAWRTRL